MGEVPYFNRGSTRCRDFFRQGREEKDLGRVIGLFFSRVGIDLAGRDILIVSK